MNSNFICPRCKSYLNIGDDIILAADTENGESGLILFNQELGNYSVSTNSGFDIQEGIRYEFYCPVCQEKLASDLHENLSRIIMVDQTGKKFEILFSKISGEKSTYKIIGESVEVYGPHASNYIDFINLSYQK